MDLIFQIKLSKVSPVNKGLVVQCAGFPMSVLQQGWYFVLQMETYQAVSASETWSTLSC